MPAPPSAFPAGLRTLTIERQALEALEAALAEPPLRQAFEATAALIARSPGRVVVTGMGKSGLVGRKIAATLASTGTPALFMHPAEASHGDLGMITGGDVVITLSWSGETQELSDVISYCQRFKVPLVAITARPQSSLASRANLVLSLPPVVEACPNRLAPTSSTILQAAVGDALAVALIEVRGFSADDFRVFHPRGQLGARLLRIADIMGTAEQVPTVDADASILTAMVEMSAKRFGITGVVDEHRRLIGAFTDGDLRRSLTTVSIEAPVRHHMTLTPLTIDADHLVSEAVAIMNAGNIMQLFVESRGTLVGIIHLHDALRAGVA